MMSEWHVTPDYIVNNWTEELLSLMIEKLAERRKQDSTSNGGSSHMVSIQELSIRSRGLIKVVRKDGD